MSARIDVRAGAVYLPAAVAGTYFRGIEAVVVLIRDGALGGDGGDRLVAPLWLAALAGGAVAGFLQPILFKDLKYA